MLVCEQPSVHGDWSIGAHEGQVAAVAPQVDRVPVEVTVLDVVSVLEVVSVVDVVTALDVVCTPPSASVVVPVTTVVPVVAVVPNVTDTPAEALQLPALAAELELCWPVEPPVLGAEPTVPPPQAASERRPARAMSSSAN